MAEECCGGEGCGCHATSFYTSRTCPICGSKVRVAGNPQTIKYRLHCTSCDFISHELSMEEFREIIDG